jgi:hypothetical protein
MSRHSDHILHLMREVDARHRQPQTVEREFQIAKMELEIKILTCEREAAVARRTTLFLDAWRKMGRFTAIRSDGAQMEANPHRTGCPVTDFYNVKSEATRLAEWSM